MNRYEILIAFLFAICVLVLIAFFGVKKEKDSAYKTINLYADSLYSTRHYYDSLLNESNKVIGSKTDSIIIEKRIQNVTYKNYITNYTSIPTSDNNKEYLLARARFDSLLRAGFFFEK